MGKGELTRQAILERATALASRVGLEGVTIGRLSEELGLSKSGLFAHFGAKQALEVEVLRFAADRFVDGVVRPALAARRGEPRVRAVFERWLAWDRSRVVPGGCLFVAAATELDDRPGPARDELVRLQQDWLETMATCFRTGITEGHFRRDADPEQFAHDLYGVMLGCHHAKRLMGDPAAEPRARAAFEALLAAARRPSTLAGEKRARARRPRPATRARAGAQRAGRTGGRHEPGSS
ncbi:MAG: TetR family transcriptional regulator [Acidobacteria bacterium]|nr:MAG: TetR family transcriptional regulator [Acidobacteriota bacterium]